MYYNVNIRVINPIQNPGFIMRNILFAIILTLLFFTSTGAFARGFSVGILGSYAIDGGAIEKNVDNLLVQPNWKDKKIDRDKILLPGAIAFLRYDFKNSLFLRTGAEYYKLLSGDSVEIGNTSTGSFYKFSYSAIACPLYFGINTSPDRGKTYIYGAAGLVFANVSIKRDEKQYQVAAPNLSHYWTETDKMLFGYSAIFGIERKIIWNTYLTLEYAAYLCEEYSSESGEGYDDAPLPPFEYTEHYGLPRHQLRVGIRYDF